MFFSAYPKEEKYGFCNRCWEESNLIGGVDFSDDGIIVCWLCESCNSLVYEKDGYDYAYHNPFEKLNDKLDRLINHLNA